MFSGEKKQKDIQSTESCAQAQPGNKTMDVLLVEANQNDVFSIQKRIQEERCRPLSLRVCATLADALDTIAKTELDAILINLELPDSSGIQTCESVLEAVDTKPVIVLTDRDDPELAAKCIALGAHDFLVKGKVEGFIATAIYNSVAHVNVFWDLKKKLSSIIEHTDAGLAVIQDGKQVFYNSRTYEMLGYSKAEYEQMDFLSIVHPDDRAITTDRIQRRLAGTDSDLKPLEVRAVTKSGETRLIQASSVKIQWEGRPAIQSFFLDITEQRRAESTYRAIFESTNAAILISTLQGVFVDANEAFLKLSGYSVEELKTFDFAAFYANPEDRKALLEAVRRDGQIQGLEAEMVTRSGVKTWVSISSRPITHLGEECLLSVIIDITERKRYERELRSNEERFRAVFNGVLEGILLADENGKFVMANRAICQMLGYTEEELLSLGVQDIHPEQDLPRIEKVFHQQMIGNINLNADTPVKRKDGTVFFADINSTLVTIEGRQLGMGCFRDVSEKRSLQATLAQSDRLASMGMLAAGVAHEINNPLAYILYNLQSMGEDLPELVASMKRCYSALRDHAGKEGAEAIAGELFNPAIFDDLLERTKDALMGTHRIKEIAHGLATFSRVEVDELSEVNLHYAIDCAINMAYNEVKYRARLVKDFGEVPTIWASDGRISQVFLNLLINAAHAIEEGDVDHNEIRIRTWTDQDNVYAEVSDTGKGIPAEDMNRLFEPFFTTKGVGFGSGLGLAICRNIVKGFGGEIGALSAVGYGSQFTIRLPVRRGPQSYSGRGR
jgi:PAS domain S-box-containing protein